MPNPTPILLNGLPLRTSSRTVAELLVEIGSSGRGVAVAVNGAVVRRADQATHALCSDDRVEIIRAVQGG